MSTETQCSWCAVESGNLRPDSHGICERHRREWEADYYRQGHPHDLSSLKAIEAYRVNTPNDDLNEPSDRAIELLTLLVNKSKKATSWRFSFRVALSCAFLGAILYLSFLLGCAVAYWRHGGGL